MYKVKNCFLKQMPIGGYSYWTTADVSKMNLKTLYEFAQSGYFIIHDEYLGNDLVAKINDYRHLFSHLELTLVKFIEDNPDFIFREVTEGDVVPREAMLKWNDGTAYHLVPEYINPTSNNQETGDDKDRTWLKLSAPNGKYDNIEDFFLVDVCGLMHQVTSTKEGIFVIDGRSSTHSDYPFTYGVWDFREIGKIRTIPITEDMLHPLQGDRTMWDGLLIDVGESLDNKTILLSICGKPMLIDGRKLRNYGENALLLNLEMINLYVTYMETYHRLGLDKLEIEESPSRRYHVMKSRFQSNEVVKKLFTLPQSFITIIDRDDIYVSREYLESNTIQDHYVSIHDPKWPLFLQDGYVSDYLCNADNGRWAVNTNRTPWKSYISKNPEMFNPENDSMLTPANAITGIRQIPKPYFFVMGLDPQIHEK